LQRFFGAHLRQATRIYTPVGDLFKDTDVLDALRLIRAFSGARVMGTPSLQQSMSDPQLP
jgi:hypothetical protein